METKYMTHDQLKPIPEKLVQIEMVTSVISLLLAIATEHPEILSVTVISYIGAAGLYLDKRNYVTETE